MTKIRTYSELVTMTSFEDRYKYLRLDGSVGRETFGFDRYLNQAFYNTPKWKRVRDFVIVRDNGCDLGVDGYEIREKIYIHHMNPISVDDIVGRTEYLIDPEYLISTTHSTHNAIHYGVEELLNKAPIVRSRHDTCPWKH